MALTSSQVLAGMITALEAALEELRANADKVGPLEDEDERQASVFVHEAATAVKATGQMIYFVGLAAVSDDPVQIARVSQRVKYDPQPDANA